VYALLHRRPIKNFSILLSFFKCGYKVGLCDNMMSFHWMSV
jgi:hypothetical protein